MIWHVATLAVVLVADSVNSTDALLDWSRCLYRETAAIAFTDIAAPEAVQAAFGKCSAKEFELLRSQAKLEIWNEDEFAAQHERMVQFYLTLLTRLRTAAESGE